MGHVTCATWAHDRLTMEARMRASWSFSFFLGAFRAFQVSWKVAGQALQSIAYGFLMFCTFRFITPGSLRLEWHRAMRCDDKTKYTHGLPHCGGFVYKGGGAKGRRLGSVW